MAQQISSLIRSFLGLGPNTVTAGGAGDNVAQNGVAINRRGFYSGVAAVIVRAVLGANQNVVTTVTVQHRPEGGAWTNLSAPRNFTLSTVSAATVEGVHEVDFDLEGAEAEIRLVVTPNLSAAGTDTATVGAVVTLGEATSLPA